MILAACFGLQYKMAGSSGLQLPSDVDVAPLSLMVSLTTSKIQILTFGIRFCLFCSRERIYLRFVFVMLNFHQQIAKSLYIDVNASFVTLLRIQIVVCSYDALLFFRFFAFRLQPESWIFCRWLKHYLLTPKILVDRIRVTSLSWTGSLVRKVPSVGWGLTTMALTASSIRKGPWFSMCIKYSPFECISHLQNATIDVICE